MRCAPSPTRAVRPLDHAIELGVVDEEVALALDLAGPRGPGRRRHRQPHVGVVAPDVRRDGALADRGRSGEHDQPVAGAPVRGDPVGDELAQPAPLQPPETAEPLRRRDLEIVHDARGLRHPDRGNRSEELGDAQPALDALGLLERLAQHVEGAARAVGDLRLDGGTGPARCHGGAGCRDTVDLGRGARRGGCTRRGARFTDGLRQLPLRTGRPGD